MNSAKIIVLLGAPASGKSSLALKLSQDTEIRVVSKDNFKVVAFETYGFCSPKEKKSLSKIAENNFLQFIGESMSAKIDLIIEGCFKSLNLLYDTIDVYTASYSEYWTFCYAEPNILADRYNRRTKSPERHPALSITNFYPFVEGISKFQNPISTEFASLYQSQLERPRRNRFLTVDTTNLYRDFDRIYKCIANFCEVKRGF